MEIPGIHPQEKIPQLSRFEKHPESSVPDTDPPIVSKPEHEMTQADWSRQRGYRDENAQAEAVRDRMKAQRPEFAPDRDDG